MSGGRLCTLIGVPWRGVCFSTLSTGRFVLKQYICKGAESAENAETAGYTYEGTPTTAWMICLGGAQKEARWRLRLPAALAELRGAATKNLGWQVGGLAVRGKRERERGRGTWRGKWRGTWRGKEQERWEGYWKRYPPIYACVVHDAVLPHHRSQLCIISVVVNSTRALSDYG